MEKKKRVYKHRPYQAVANLSKLTEEQKSKVKELYLQGSSQSYIEKTLQMTRKTIRTILKAEGIDRDKSSQWRLRYGSSLKENVFDDLNPESLYWIGFLYADGHIGINTGKNKGFNIELGIDECDTDHMEKYRKFLGCDKPLIFPKNKNMCVLKVYSKVIHSRLKELGFTNRKSWDAKPHELLKNSRDFWRGVMDGDGSLSNQHDCAFIHQSGTKDTTDSLIEFLKDNGLISVAKSRRCLEGHVLHQVSWACAKARFIADILYKDSSIYLERKYLKYLSWFNKKEKDIEELVNTEIKE